MHFSTASAIHQLKWVTGLILIFGFRLCTAQEHLLVGVVTHVPTREGLSLLEQCGVDSVRDDLWWSAVEVKAGHYQIPRKFLDYNEDLRDHEIEPLWVLGYRNPLYLQGERPTTDAAREAYARYAEYCVGELKGRVHYWEIWNEWNWNFGSAEGKWGGTPQDYVKLMKIVYPRLKKIDPKATILAGAVAGTDIPWLKAACQAGLLQYCDGVSIHPYCHGATGENYLPETGWLDRVNRYRNCLRSFNSGNPTPLYITEIGWPTYLPQNRRAFSPQDVGHYVSRLFLLASTIPELKAVWWYDFKDDGLNPYDQENNFGILRNDLTPKPAYYALKDVAAFLKRAKFVSNEDTRPATGLKIIRFRTQDDTDAFAVWTTQDNHTWQISWLAPDRKAGKPVRITTCGANTVKRQWSINPQTCTSILTVTANSTPVIIEGNFDNAVLHELRQIR